VRQEYPARTFHLVFHSDKGCARRLRFAHSDGMSVKEEHVVDVTVAFIELELTNRDGRCGGQVHVVAIL
jgi:hypothetical protein